MHNEIFEAELEEEMRAEESEFVIDSDEMAEWALKRVLAAKKEKERLSALIDAERERLDLAQENVDERYEHDTSYLLHKLNKYFETVEHKQTKTQESYQLLSGKLIFKKPSQKMEQDKGAFLAWCKDNASEYVKTEESVAWGEIKKQLNIVGDAVIYGPTGEIVSGVAIAEVAGVFDVKA